MQIAKFSKISETLDELDSWLQSLGIKSKDDRWHRAADMVQRAREQREIVENGGSASTIDNYVEGLFEAMEIHEIVRAFRGDTSVALKTKLKRALCGPISPSNEQPKNSEARNAMFELSLAADWKNSGLVVELGEPDICVHFEAASFRIECKRPFSGHSVRASIKDAASQLGNELDKPGNKNDYGVLAISLSRVFRKGNLICFAQEDKGGDIIKESLADLLDKNKDEWRLKCFPELHKRIVAILFHLAAPWDINGERLIHLSASHFIDTGRNGRGWKVLKENHQQLKWTFV